MTRVRGFSGPVVLTRVSGYPAPIAQPRRGYRFGPENLLLPQLVGGPQEHIIDLGAGCGVLGLLVAHALGAQRLTLVEREPNMAALCRYNASTYQRTTYQRTTESSFETSESSFETTGSSFETTGSSSASGSETSGSSSASGSETSGSSFETTGSETTGSSSASGSETSGSSLPAISVAQVDLRSLQPSTASMVIANPPFFAAGAGRMSSEPTTTGATHALHGGVTDFVRVAADALAPHGRLWLLYPADALADALSALLAVGLGATEVVVARARHSGRPYRVWICASSAADRPLVVKEMTTWTDR